MWNLRDTTPHPKPHINVCWTTTQSSDTYEPVRWHTPANYLQGTASNTSLQPLDSIHNISWDWYITMTSYWVRLRLESPASRLFIQPLNQAQIKENIKFRVTGLCSLNSPVTGESPIQRASNAENVSIWWSHDVTGAFCTNAVSST